MPRRTEPIVIPFADALLTPQSPSEAEQLLMQMAMFRTESAEHSRTLDQCLLGRMGQQHRALQSAKSGLEQLQKKIADYQNQAWHPALYRGPVRTSAGVRHCVFILGRDRTVMCAGEVDPTGLRSGDMVLLGPEMNLIVAAMQDSGGLFKDGLAATFLRFEDEQHTLMRIKWRDEERLVGVAEPLRSAPLKSGDLVRWREDMSFAFGTMTRDEKKPYRLDEVPDLSPDRLGGQREAFDRLMHICTMNFLHRDEAQRYGLLQATAPAILLYGASGNGKTLLARIIASQVQKKTGKKTAFCLVQPAELQSSYVGQTEANTRALFESVRQAEQAVLFFDEIDSVGRARGNVNGFHHDRFLAALLSEIDGFLPRGNVILIGATNFVDSLDVALRSRFRIEIEVPRPDRAATAEILSIHLPQSLPVAFTCDHQPQNRASLVESIVTAIFSGHTQPLARVHLADGKHRAVTPRDLVSGRLLADIAYLASEAAFRREIDGVTPGAKAGAGVTELDVLSATESVFTQLARSLTPRNVRDFVTDLPRDIQVVDVKHVPKRVRQPLAFLNFVPSPFAPSPQRLEAVAS